jgi:hypothetical protein
VITGAAGGELTFIYTYSVQRMLVKTRPKGSTGPGKRVPNPVWETLKPDKDDADTSASEPTTGGPGGN